LDFNNINELKKEGYEGFISMRQLFEDASPIPAFKGVYCILNNEKVYPSFLEIGTGGHFKGKNPNISIKQLENNWVDKSLVVYIGKAGGENSNATLKSRLKQYFSFGQGKNIGHWGGRLIWQLPSSSDLVVCWKVLLNEDPRKYEQQLIQEYITQFGSRPFANLSD
jgi:hypothetical protein